MKYSEEYYDGLPYGFYLRPNGNEILFNRNYEPLIERSPDGDILNVSRDEWVDYVGRYWFRNDGRHNPRFKGAEGKAARSRCEKILQDFLGGRDVSKYVINSAVERESAG